MQVSGIVIMIKYFLYVVAMLQVPLTPHLPATTSHPHSWIAVVQIVGAQGYKLISNIGKANICDLRWKALCKFLRCCYSALIYFIIFKLWILLSRLFVLLLSIISKQSIHRNF
jgi:hypothetical protein